MPSKKKSKIEEPINADMLLLKLSKLSVKKFIEFKPANLHELVVYRLLESALHGDIEAFSTVVWKIFNLEDANSLLYVNEARRLAAWTPKKFEKWGNAQRDDDVPVYTAVTGVAFVDAVDSSDHEAITTIINLVV